jgi:hypothetical protein
MFSPRGTIGYLVSLTLCRAVHASGAFHGPLQPFTHVKPSWVQHELEMASHSTIQSNPILDESNGTISERWIELPLDHFGECSNTYSNRYWVQDAWYTAGGPVIVLDVGEQSGTALFKSLKTGFFANTLKELGAMGILWEHRFYGSSSPPNWHDQLQYLNFEQALADIPAMAARFSHPNWPAIDLTPASTPWAMMGCSYAGARTASTRQAYPNTIHAAIAGGAPVQWQSHAWRYYQTIMRGMRSFGMGGCVNDIQAGNTRLDQLLEDSATANATKQRFFGDLFPHMRNREFSYILASFFDVWQYSGPVHIKPFCKKLESDPATNTTAPPEGWAPTKGAEFVIERMIQAYGYGEPSRDEPTERSIERSVTAPFEAGEALTKRADHDGKSWGWQMCTEFGAYTTSNPGLHHFMGKYVTYKWLQDVCQRGLPNGTQVAGAATTRKLIQEYGGWSMRPSNLLWTMGEFDPWESMQPLSHLGNAPPVEVLAEPPQCDTKLPRSQIFGHIVSGASHCFDMSDDIKGEAIEETQRLYIRSLKAWIPCFQKKSQAEVTVPTPPKCMG